MSVQRVCICHVQVPFVRGGAELLVEGLRDALQARGLTVDIVSLPFKWYPSREVLSSALAWRLVDLTESSGKPIDLVIPTKFPSYLVRHPNNVTWLFHQFRQAYDLYGTEFGDLGEDPSNENVLATVRNMDNARLPESRSIYTIAGNVSKRLHRYNGIESTPLYPPPPLGERYHCQEYGDFILSVGRLESIKRVDLLLRALAASKNRTKCVVVGVGPDEQRLLAMSHELGIDDRVTFAGYVSEEALLDLYARCRAVYNAPYDEDYGFVTLEAFRAQKPVITTTDSGGVLEFVRDGETGWVTEPSAAAVATAIDRAMDDATACERMGRLGCSEVSGISWEHVTDVLLNAAS